MRIGIFTDAYLPSISGLVTSELMLKEALEKMGHEVYVVTVNVEELKYKYDKENKVIYVPGVPTKIYDTRLTTFYNPRAFNQIRKWKLEIIHTQTEFSVGTFGRIVAKQLDIPLVHTYHTMYEDYIYYLTKGYFDKPSKKLVEYLTKFYCDTTVSQLIVPTKKIYNIFKEKYNPGEIINIIPTGIDVERFSKNNINKEELNRLIKKYELENSFVIGSVSRLGKEKDVDKLIIEFSKLIDKIPNIKLLLVGDGPDKKYLKDLTKELKISKNVIFVGKVPIEKVQIYYHLMDVFSTFSTTETQGLTVLEALASSKPVVAIKDDSFEGVIKNNVNGYLFTRNIDFNNYICKLYNDKLLYKKLVEGSYKTALENSREAFGQKVYNVYSDSIKNYKKGLEIFNEIKDVINTSKIKHNNLNDE
jgi:1,2-diacylglycerol 3-alpha-glucosyltransferase